MESVSHRCAECGRTPEETKFRTTNTVQGERLRKYCGECSKARERRLSGKPEREKTALVPSRVESVEINERPVLAVWMNEFQRYWPVKAAVEAAGLAWPSQWRRIQDDTRLAQGITSLVIPSAGGSQETVCLPWEAWHYFWTGVSENQVSPGAYPVVMRIKDEAYAALAAAFGDGPKTTMPVHAQPVQSLAVANDPALHAKVDTLIQWTEGVDQVQRTIKLCGSLYIARIATEEFTNPAKMLQPYIDDAAHWLGRGYMLCCVGKSTGDPHKRITKHRGKIPSPLISVPVCVLDTDDPDTGESFLRNNPPMYPRAYKIQKGDLKDWFWVDPMYLRMIPETWPRYVTVADLVTTCREWCLVPTVVTVQQMALLEAL